MQKIELPWDTIDTVLLDMDGTLLDLHYDNYFWLEYLPEQLAKMRNQSLESCKAELYDMSEQVKGSLDWYSLEYWSDILSVDIAKLKRQVDHKINFRPNTLEFLNSLKQRNKRVILATNAHPQTLELKLMRADFSSYFEHLSSSHDLGYPKEVPEYWHALMQKFKLTPKHCLFIDDSHSVLNAAQSFGIGHILAIEQPDLSKNSQDCSPYTGINNFSQLI